MTHPTEGRRRRASGDGSVYYVKKRDRWVGVFNGGVGPDGKRSRPRLSARTEREAEKLLREMQRQHAQNCDVAASRMTVIQLVTKWRTDVAPKTQSVKTQQVTEGLCRLHVLPAVGALKVTEVTPEHIEKAMQVWVAKGLSRSTIFKCRNVLAAAFRHAESRRIISWNPAKLADLPPPSATRPQGERTVLNAEQLAALIAAATGTRKQLFVTLLGTYGMRPGELTGLRWENVDLETGVVHITESMHWNPTGPEFGPTKTGRSRRPIQLAPADTAALAEHRRQQAVERDFHANWPSEWAGLVFATANGRPIDPHNLRRDVKALGKRIGIENLTPYGLRGTATSIAAEAGVPAEELADLLGHTDTTMVMRHYRKRLRPAYDAGLAVARLREAGGQL